ncbi:hypothetical protein [Streptomyces yaizuensis]|uniref:Uncharacterized protein n=1 Tax=Streptomyces yaizuensis TaxID=2989713 RepID=A0ABQ5P2U3_9ACTN|nr:hypothetical protein [Streptomyces sp. YSPA8]GLF96927.1 hypothetical protein SYYSPA8_21540 [Streptomyces sp. YSPA8]
MASARRRTGTPAVAAAQVTAATVPTATGPEPDRAETALAVADAACTGETGVVGVRSAVDAAHQRRARAEHAARPAAVARDIRTRLRTTDRVLADR